MSDPSDAVAVVGISGRFPGAGSIREFWRNLVEGRETISRFSWNELVAQGYRLDDIGSPDFVPSKGVLRDADCFDAAFFGFSPREAALMDPQQRIFLECAWEAMEDAGYDPRGCKCIVGVYAGSRLSTYGYSVFAQEGNLQVINDVPFLLGNDKDYLTTRVSYKLGFTGPSVSISTACSTALVAVGTAVNALLDYQVDMALAGGVRVSVPLKAGYSYIDEGIQSRDGHCRAFDASASGTVFGDGAGVVLLKRLEDATRDADDIYAVIRGVGINNDGGDRAAYTAPSVEGQVAVIRLALAASGVAPESLSYVECHGTGTQVGDAIEIRALKEAFGGSGRRATRCAIGSVKSNLGHLSQAAGMASLIKTVLALKHGKLPPTINVERENPSLGLQDSPFYINTQLSEWPRANGAPRRAGVSSFGIGGTNAHLILEEAPRRAVRGYGNTLAVIPISAKTPAAVRAIREALLDHLAHAVPPIHLAEVAWTMVTGRSSFAHRSFLLARQNAAGEIQFEPGHAVDTAFTSAKTMLCLPAYRGEPAEVSGDLYTNEPQFRAALDECLAALDRWFAADVEMLPATRGSPARLRLVASVPDAQCGPALLFSVQYALSQLLLSRGLKVHAVAGRGLGEVTAACVAGVLAIDEALRLAVVFGRAEKETAWESVLAPSDRAPEIGLFSAVTGTWMTDPRSFDLNYWRDVSQSLSGRDVAVSCVGAGGSWIVIGVGENAPSWLLGRASQTDARFLHCPAGADSDDPRARVLECLGHAWNLGAEVNWSAGFGDERPARAHLPTYPFERKRHWIGPTAADDAPRAVRRVESWLHQLAWKRLDLDPPVAPFPVRKTFLILAENPVNCGSLVAALSGGGSRVIVATNGEQASFADESRFCFDWSSSEHFAELLVELARRDARPDVVVFQEAIHPWNGNGAEDPPWRSSRDLQTMFLPLLRYFKAESAQGVRRFSLFFLTNRAFHVEGVDTGPTDPFAGVYLGALRAIACEFPEVSCKLLDLRVGPGESAYREADLRALTSLLRGERIASKDHLAIRENGIWSRQVVELDAARAPSAPAPRTQGKTFLITGGLGGIGLTTAECLGERGDCRIVLIGRSGLPPREDWEQTVKSASASEKLKRQIVVVTSLLRAGNEVIVLPADISDARAVRSLARELRDKFGAVHGIVHAAGQPDGALIGNKDCDEISPVIAPKLDGTLHLLREFGSPELEFLVLYSSLNSVLGRFGQVDYCAANAYLDAAADVLSRTNSYRVTSVNWDVWSDVGMAVDTEVSEQLAGWRQETLRTGIRLEEGRQIVRRVLNGDCGHQVIVCTRGADGLGGNHLDQERTRFRDLMRKLSLSKPRPAAKQSTPASADDLRDDFEIQVAGILRDVLGVEQIGRHDNFITLGGDSLTATMFVSRFRKQLGAKLSLGTFLSEPTIAAISRACGRSS